MRLEKFAQPNITIFSFFSFFFVAKIDLRGGTWSIHLVGTKGSAIDFSPSK